MASKNAQTRNEQRQRRHQRIRTHLAGTAARPRISVYRSNTALRLQLIDDAAAKTLASASTTEAAKGTVVERAKEAGKLLAERAKALGITSAVFDRSGYVYTGKVRAAAEGAREGGLVF